MNDLLTRPTRVRVAGIRVNHRGEDNNSGVFVAGFFDANNGRRHPTIDIRYFRSVITRKGMVHRPTRWGVILDSQAEALELAQALVDIVAEMRKAGLTDES